MAEVDELPPHQRPMPLGGVAIGDAREPALRPKPRRGRPRDLGLLEARPIQQQGVLLDMLGEV